MLKSVSISAALLALCGLFSATLRAQVAETDTLFIALQRQDSLLFERGFNRCDLDYLAGVVADELRFYHDQSGVQDRADFLENTRRYICANPDLKPIRQLEAGSLEVFPLYDNGRIYGAIQRGVHHFYLRESGKADRWTSVARFTHVWLWRDGRWQLGEVLSYDHRSERP